MWHVSSISAMGGLCAALFLCVACAALPAPAVSGGERIELPSPSTASAQSLEEALAGRRSVREYGRRPLSLAEIGQLLWAAQGITSIQGYRTAPSAGALYPLEVYVVLPEGVYHYEPAEHVLSRTVTGSRQRDVGAAALDQEAIYRAPAVFVIAAVYERTAIKYGSRAERYVEMEAGHAAQNLLLQAAALGLGAVPIGAFYDDRLQAALDLPNEEKPLYVIPVGALSDH